MPGRWVATASRSPLRAHSLRISRQGQVFADERGDNAVVEVLLRLKWQNRIVGVLYVDDEFGREFTPKEARRNLLPIRQQLPW